MKPIHSQSHFHIGFSLRNFLAAVAFIAMLLSVWVAYRDVSVRQRQQVKSLILAHGFPPCSSADAEEILDQEWTVRGATTLRFGTTGVSLGFTEKNTWLSAFYPAHQLIEVSVIEIRSDDSRPVKESDFDEAITATSQLTSARMLMISTNACTTRHFAEIARHLVDLTYIHASPLTDEACEHLSTLSELERVGGNINEMTDVGLNHLRHLPHLSEIDLGAALQVTGSGIGELHHLKRLTVGPFDFAPGFSELPKCSNLAQLNTYSTDISDSSAEAIGRIPKITTLFTHASGLSDAGMQAIVASKSLRELALMGRHQVSARGLSAPMRAPLVKLSLEMNSQQFVGVVMELTKIASLKDLSLKCGVLSQEDLKLLSGMTHLQNLALDTGTLSDSQFSQLKLRLPHTRCIIGDL